MQDVQNMYSQMRKDFYEKYQKQIVPCVRKYENERKQKLALAMIAGGILSLIGLGILSSLIFNPDLDSDAQEGVLKGGLIFFGLAYGAWFCIKKGFENKIKGKIMPIVCSCFENLTWAEGKNINSSLFLNSGLIPTFTSEDYDDTFKGSHKDVGIEIIEAEFERGSGKNRTTVFKGAIVLLDMNKNFSSHTVVVPDTLLHSTPVKGLRHTTLEDVQFEKKFDVFTNDEVEARYLLTPTFMERLNGIKTAFCANKVRCAFYGNYLLIALSSNKDLFSLCSLVTPIDDSKQYFQMYEEMVSIVKLIDHFKLDQKIGL